MIIDARFEVIELVKEAGLRNGFNVVKRNGGRFSIVSQFLKNDILVSCNVANSGPEQTLLLKAEVRRLLVGIPAPRKVIFYASGAGFYC